MSILSDNLRLRTLSVTLPDPHNWLFFHDIIDEYPALSYYNAVALLHSKNAVSLLNHLQSVLTKRPLHTCDMQSTLSQYIRSHPHYSFDDLINPLDHDVLSIKKTDLHTIGLYNESLFIYHCKYFTMFSIYVDELSFLFYCNSDTYRRVTLPISLFHFISRLCYDINESPIERPSCIIGTKASLLLSLRAITTLVCDPLVHVNCHPTALLHSFSPHGDLTFAAIVNCEPIVSAIPSLLSPVTSCYSQASTLLSTQTCPFLRPTSYFKILSSWRHEPMTSRHVYEYTVLDAIYPLSQLSWRLPSPLSPSGLTPPLPIEISSEIVRLVLQSSLDSCQCYLTPNASPRPLERPIIRIYPLTLRLSTANDVVVRLLTSMTIPKGYGSSISIQQERSLRYQPIVLSARHLLPPAGPELALARAHLTRSLIDDRILHVTQHATAGLLSPIVSCSLARSIEPTQRLYQYF